MKKIGPELTDTAYIRELLQKVDDLERELRKAVELLSRSKGINVTNGPDWRNERDAFLARHKT